MTEKKKAPALLEYPTHPPVGETFAYMRMVRAADMTIQEKALCWYLATYMGNNARCGYFSPSEEKATAELGWSDTSAFRRVLKQVRLKGFVGVATLPGTRRNGYTGTAPLEAQIAEGWVKPEPEQQEQDDDTVREGTGICADSHSDLSENAQLHTRNHPIPSREPGGDATGEANEPRRGKQAATAPPSEEQKARATEALHTFCTTLAEVNPEKAQVIWDVAPTLRKANGLIAEMARLAGAGLEFELIQHCMRPGPHGGRPYEGSDNPAHLFAARVFEFANQHKDAKPKAYISIDLPALLTRS